MCLFLYLPIFRQYPLELFDKRINISAEIFVVHVRDWSVEGDL